MYVTIMEFNKIILELYYKNGITLKQQNFFTVGVML